LAGVITEMNGMQEYSLVQYVVKFGNQKMISEL
jgi:hypothetical protein